MSSQEAMVAAAGSVRPFVGRVDTVETLRRQFEEARGGGGSLTLLVGETGVGKSALVAELARYMRTRDTRVLMGRALPLDDPPPFSLVRSALESAQEEAVSKTADTPLGGDSVLIGFAPGFAVSAFAAPVDFEAKLLDTLGGASSREEMSGERVLSEMAEQFLEFAQHGPTVLLLEDLHRADDSSLAAVEVLASRLEGHPLWVLATSRQYASLTDSGRARLEKFEAATHPRKVALGPLTSREVVDYLRLDDPSREISPEEVARRYSESGGNPLLLEQLERRDALGREALGLAGAALPAVDEEAQFVLEAASVLGSEFPFGTLLRANGGDEERLAEAVDRLVDRGLLFERPGELLAFPEDRLREEVYTQIPETRLPDLHRRAGEALEGLDRPDPAMVYSLARHFYLGQDHRKSLEYNRLAAESAERALAPDVASSYLIRALESQRNLDPDDLDGEAKLVVEMGRLTYDLGLLEQAESFLRSYLDRRGDDPRLGARLRATVELYLARVLTSRGDSPGAVRLAEKILSTPGLEDDRLLRIGALRQMGISLYYQGRYAESLDYNAEEIRLAREVGNERLIALALIWQAGNFGMIGKPDLALASAREIAATLDRLGTAPDSAAGHLFLGNMLADTRSNPAYRQEAIAELAKTIRFAEEAHDLRKVGWAYYHTAEVLREEGRLEAADRNAQRAFETLGQVGDLAGQGVAVKVRGQIATTRGEYKRAERDLVEAQRLLQGLKHRLEEIDVLLRLAQLSAARGDPAKALERLADLDRMDLPRARPDLAAEFEELRRSLGTKGGDLA